MKILYRIEVELYGIDGILRGGIDFLHSYADNRYGKTTTFIYSDKNVLSEALSLLTKYALNYKNFYDFEIEHDELENYPAIYFGIFSVLDLITDEKVNEDKFGNSDMATDYESESIVVTPHIRKIMEEKARGLQWELVRGTDGRELMLMNVVECLLEPVVIPSPVHVNPNEHPPGTYAVQSDGRDVITNANISKLMDVGLAVSQEVKTQSRVLKWRPRLVASGALISTLQSANIKGLLEPVSPLIPESHPLAHDSVGRHEAFE